MKEITLISVEDDIYAFGLRRIASFIKKNNDFKVNTVFLTSMSQTSLHWSMVIKKDASHSLSDNLVKQIIKVTEKSDLIGISTMGPNEPIAILVTSAIKKAYPEKKVIWGGVLPSTAPERCLNYADYVCVGEGEKSLSMFLDAYSSGKEVLDIKGIWGKRDDKIIKNAPVPLEFNLDNLGFPEYAFDNQYAISNNKLVELNQNTLKLMIGKTLMILMTQGCPYNCTYCTNSALIGIEKNYARIRHYTVSNFINNLEEKIKHLEVESISFQDDSFFSLSMEVVSDFCEKWKKQINLPFHVLGASPDSFDEEKLDLMVDAGLKRIRVGVQSGSEEIRKNIYKRRYSNKSVIGISKAIRKKQMSVCDYDFILDCPWETLDDKLEGLELLNKMSPPFTLNLFGLTFIENSELYEKALSEGIIDEDCRSQKYTDYKINNDYINFLFSIYSVVHIPEKLHRILLNKKLLTKNYRIPKFIFSLLQIVKYIRISFNRIKHKDPTNVPYYNFFTILRRMIGK